MNNNSVLLMPLLDIFPLVSIKYLRVQPSTKWNLMLLPSKRVATHYRVIKYDYFSYSQRYCSTCKCALRATSIKTAIISSSLIDLHISLHGKSTSTSPPMVPSAVTQEEPIPTLTATPPQQRSVPRGAIESPASKGVPSCR